MHTKIGLFTLTKPISTIFTSLIFTNWTLTFSKIKACTPYAFTTTILMEPSEACWTHRVTGFATFVHGHTLCHVCHCAILCLCVWINYNMTVPMTNLVLLVITCRKSKATFILPLITTINFFNCTFRYKSINGFSSRVRIWTIFPFQFHAKHCKFEKANHFNDPIRFWNSGCPQTFCLRITVNQLRCLLILFFLIIHV